MFLLIIITLLTKYVNSNIISLPIENLRVSLSFSDTNTPYKYYLDFDLNFSCIDGRILPSASLPLNSLNKYNEVNLYHTKYNFTILEGSLTDEASKFTINNILFYYYQGNCTYIDPPLAFIYKIDKSSSIIYQAYMNKIINRPSFFIEYGKNETGILYMGGVPQHYDSYKKGFCELMKNMTNWGCKLTSIIFLEYEFNVGEFAEISYSPPIRLKKNFADYFTEVTREMKYEGIKSGKEIFLPIKIRFGNYLFRINEQIKINYHGEYILYTFSNAKNYNLGYDFINAFNVYFDYLADKIEIYGKEGIEEVIDPLEYKKKQQKNLYYFNIALLCLSIISLIYTKMNYLNYGKKYYKN